MFITKATGKINGRAYDISCETALFVPHSSPLKELLFECNITEEERSLLHIDMEITLELRNMIGYEYTQILYIGFKNDNGNGTVDRFNMSLQEVLSNAH